MAKTALRLMCVDDDPMALDHLRRVLVDLDDVLTCAYYGSPLLAAKAQREDAAELVITDLKMGTTTGLQLIEEMRECAPDSIYMMLSGEADLESALLAVNEAQVFRFFTKPPERDDIQRGVLEAVREYNLRQMRHIANSTMSAIERLKIAVASADAEGEIIYANPTAQNILSQSGYFSLGANGRIRSIDPAQTKRFRELLQILATSEEDARESNVFRFTKPDGEHPMIVSALYMNGAEAGEPRFSLVFHDPSRKDVVTVDGIGAALNLTPSEARVVCGLVEGGSVEDAADKAGVSISTARTYLKHVFSKTGVSRQAELVRLALLSAA